MKPEDPSPLAASKYQWLLGAVVVLVIGFAVIVWNYQSPKQKLWDESFYLSSAQRYLDGKMFMENHPPLGKLLMALGESVLQPNVGLDTSSMGVKDTVENLPEGFSFAGVRFFPVVLSWLSVLLFFILCGLLTKRPFPALVLTLPYVLQNALVIHFRAAMLGGIQVFFLLSALIAFVC